MGSWPLHGREGRDTEIHVTIPTFCQSIGFWVDPERSVVESAESCANETWLEQNFRATEPFRTNSDDIRGELTHC